MGGLFWSNEEIVTLRKLYPQYIRDEVSRNDLLKVFCNRSFESIQCKAQGLGFGKGIKGKINREYLADLRRKGVVI